MLPPRPRSLLPAAATALLWGAAASAQGIGFGQGDFDRSAPVEVSAENLTVDQDTGRAVLTEDVVIIQGDLRLSAREVVVDYATVDGNRRIERLEATGEVLLVAGEDAAEGEYALYTLESGDIVMTGDVVVTQDGEGTVAGDRLEVNLDTGAGTVTGRVRTVLQP